MTQGFTLSAGSKGTVIQCSADLGTSIGNYVRNDSRKSNSVDSARSKWTVTCLEATGAMATAEVNDGVMGQSSLKMPVTEVIDPLTDDERSSVSHDEADAGKLDLGDEDEWSMFEDALAQEHEDLDGEEIDSSGYNVKKGPDEGADRMV